MVKSLVCLLLLIANRMYGIDKIFKTMYGDIDKQYLQVMKKVSGINLLDTFLNMQFYL